MRRLSYIFLLFWLVALPLAAQNSKKVKDLQKQRDQLQQELKRSQKRLDETKRDINQHRQTQRLIGEQLEQHLDSIRQAEDRMLLLDSQMVVMHEELYELAYQLQEKKEKYAEVLRAARAYGNMRNTSLHILSARHITEVYQRAHETNQMADIIRSLGEELIEKEAELLVLENGLLEAREEMNSLMISVMEQRRDLGIQQQNEELQISQLGTQQRGLENQLSRQRSQLTQLNKKIDAVVAAEVEAARKKAEEARRRAAASSSSGSKKSSGSSGSSSASTDKWLTPEERTLNGNFVQNKGRLPIPITGNYKIGERFGTYNVPGMKNVQLDNKGVNYIGMPGAQARAIFDGEVTAVFQFYNTKGVLVRHGSYITVYCNLSVVKAQRGQKVKARDVLGTVATNEDGQCVLHFQLRKETQKLNPEGWIGK